jgi:hypothetical protein
VDNEHGIPDWAQEIRERVVRIETKLDYYNGIRETAHEAKNMSISNCEAIREIKGNMTWLWRTIGGALIVAAVAALLTIM